MGSHHQTKVRWASLWVSGSSFSFMEPQKHLEDIGEQAPTINKMQSEGPGMCWPLRFPLTILSSVEIKSFPHTSVVLQRNGSFSLFLQIGVIVAPTDLRGLLSAAAFVLNL